MINNQSNLKGSAPLSPSPSNNSVKAINWKALENFFSKDFDITGLGISLSPDKVSSCIANSSPLELLTKIFKTIKEYHPSLQQCDNTTSPEEKALFKLLSTGKENHITVLSAWLEASGSPNVVINDKGVEQHILFYVIDTGNLDLIRSYLDQGCDLFLCITINHSSLPVWTGLLSLKDIVLKDLFDTYVLPKKNLLSEIINYLCCFDNRLDLIKYYINTRNAPTNESLPVYIPSLKETILTTPIMQTLINGRLEVCEYLLSKGVKLPETVNFFDSSGKKISLPIFQLINDMDVFKFLLENKAFQSLSQEDLFKIFSYYICNDKLDYAQIFLNYVQLDPKYKNEDGFTLLSYALLYQNKRAIELFWDFTEDKINYDDRKTLLEVTDSHEIAQTIWSKDQRTNEIIVRRKYLAHVFGIPLKTKIQKYSIELEGIRSPKKQYHHVQSQIPEFKLPASFEDYFNSYKFFFTETELEELIEFYQIFSKRRYFSHPKELFDRWKQGKVIGFHAGWKLHTTILVMKGNTCIHCNRGERDVSLYEDPGAQIFTIENPEAFTSELIEKITQNESQEFIERELPAILGLSLRKTHFFGNQPGGFCTFTSLKTALGFGAFYLIYLSRKNISHEQAENKARNLHSAVSFWNQKKVLTDELNYIEELPEAETDPTLLLFCLAKMKGKFPERSRLLQHLDGQRFDWSAQDSEGNGIFHYLRSYESLQDIINLCHPNDRKKMLEAMNKKNNDGKTPVMQTMTNPKHRYLTIALIDHLIDNGADINSCCDNSGNNLLHLSVLYNVPYVFVHLIRRGADPSVKNKEEQNCTDLACSKFIQFFLSNWNVKERKLDWNARTDSGCNFFHFVNDADTFNSLTWLRKDDEEEAFYQALNTVNDSGWTPLVGAIVFEQEELAEAMLQQMANPTIPFNDNKKTPLHYAASLGQAGVVAQLLLSGADPEAKDEDGDTTRVYAQKFTGELINAWNPKTHQLNWRYRTVNDESLFHLLNSEGDLKALFKLYHQENSKDLLEATEAKSDYGLNMIRAIESRLDDPLKFLRIMVLLNQTLSSIDI